MPLYEYQCKQCARRTEKIQKFSDPELTVCPHCGGSLERTLTAAALQFKGGGWYKDLYSSAKPPAAPASGGDASASNSGGDSSATPATSAASDKSASKPSESSTPAASSAAPAPAAAPAKT
ncbi:MAG TPA: zinc ribbon domain-containing protein [Acidobacteriaceae bacterium]